MEYNKINYDLIQECLGACESKESMMQLFTACSASLLDSELKVLKADNLPGVLKTMPESLGISNEKAVTLIFSLHSLLKEYLSMDEESMLARFPETFNKKMKTALFKMMREVCTNSKKHY